MENTLKEPDLRNEDRIPIGQKIAYSMGVVSDHYANNCIAWIFITPFFVDFLGIGAFVVGLALAAARCWDAFTDPLVGSLSDSCRSRYGRRKPFIFIGAILTGILFPFIWMVPDSWSTAHTTIYLFVALILFYSVYSIFSVPYEALGSELTPDYSERSKIFVVRKYVQEIFNLGIIWVFPFAAWLGTLAWVGSKTGGIRVASYMIALVIIGAGILPAIFNVERYKSIAARKERNSLKDTFKAIGRNKPLLIIVGIIGTYLFAIMATANLAYFVNVYYIYEGDILRGASLGGLDGTLRLSFALGAAAVIGKLSERVDKQKIMITSVVILIIAYIGVYYTTIPGRPLLSLSMKPLVAIGECGFWVLILSMRADVCDWDEYKTGTRNEGLIAAITNWFNKIAITLAIAISGFLLQYVIQFDSKLSPENEVEVVAQANSSYAELYPVGKVSSDESEVITLDMHTENIRRKAVIAQQSPGTMQRMRALYTLPQVFALIICLVLLKRYPLSKKKMIEIRNELETRRGKTDNS